MQSRSKTRQETAEADASPTSAATEEASKDPVRRLRNRAGALAIPAALVLVFVVVAMVGIRKTSDKITVDNSSTENSRSSSAGGSIRQTKDATSLAASSATIPECEAYPWKPDENLVGGCPGSVSNVPGIDNAAECAASCCAKKECILWQYRRHRGCLQGDKDVRIGMEKDGPPGWCSDVPPIRWEGQKLILREKGKIIGNNREKACDAATWDPTEQPGQCFGLGDVRTEVSSSATACRGACCADISCGGWQFSPQMGCFYGSQMFSCTTDSPGAFDPWVGRRKIQPSRAYTTSHENR